MSFRPEPPPLRQPGFRPDGVAPDSRNPQTIFPYTEREGRKEARILGPVFWTWCNSAGDFWGRWGLMLVGRLWPAGQSHVYYCSMSWVRRKTKTDEGDQGSQKCIEHHRERKGFSDVATFNDWETIQRYICSRSESSLPTIASCTPADLQILKGVNPSAAALSNDDGQSTQT